MEGPSASSRRIISTDEEEDGSASADADVAAAGKVSKGWKSKEPATVEASRPEWTGYWRQPPKLGKWSMRSLRNQRVTHAMSMAMKRRWSERCHWSGEAKGLLEAEAAETRVFAAMVTVVVKMELMRDDGEGEQGLVLAP